MRARSVTGEAIALLGSAESAGGDEGSEASGKPRPGNIHNLQFQLVQLFQRNVDVFLVPNDIKEIVVNGTMPPKLP